MPVPLMPVVLLVDLIDLLPQLSMIITAALQTQGQGEDSHSHVQAASNEQNV